MSIRTAHKNQRHKDPGKFEDGPGEGKLPPRERIVSAACELFRSHGIRGIGVDAIAEAADTNKMTLYRHFGSKDDLICEVLRSTSRKAACVWDELESTYPGDAKAQLRAWIAARARCLESEPYGCDFANAAIELKEEGHPAHSVIEEFKTQQRGRLVELCAKAGIAQADLLADMLSMLLEGARVSRQAVGGDGPSTQFAKACEATISSLEHQN